MSGRIRHLDALRTFSMLFGLFVHGVMLVTPDPFPFVGLATVILCGFSPLVSRIAGGAQDWLVLETLRYMPFFALGVMLRITPALFEWFHRVSLPALAAGVALAVGVDRLAPGLPSAVLTGMEVFTRAALTLPAVSTLLWICRALFSGPSRTVGALTESIYTMYLFHCLALYFACVALAFSATFALHRLVVSRVPFLRPLFNGRPMPARVPDA